MPRRAGIALNAALIGAVSMLAWSAISPPAKPAHLRRPQWQQEIDRLLNRVKGSVTNNDDSPLTASMLMNALRIAQERETTPGEYTLRTLQSNTAYFKTRNPQKHREYAKSGYKITSTLPGSNPRRWFFTLHMALASKAQGDLEKTNAYLDEMMTLYTSRTYRHNWEKISFVGLGAALHSMRRLDETERVLTEQVQACHRRGVADSTAYAMYNTHLAGVHYLRGNYEEAEACYHRIIKSEQARGKHGSIYVAQATQGMGVCARDRGDLQTALTYLESARRIMRELLGDSSISIANNLVTTANIYQFWDRIEPQHILLAREALAMRQQLSRPEPELAEAHLALGVCLMRSGQMQEALAHLETAAACELRFDRWKEQYARLALLACRAALGPLSAEELPRQARLTKELSAQRPGGDPWAAIAARRWSPLQAARSP